LTLAYRIVDWKLIGEVTNKGKAVQKDTLDAELTKKRPTYIRKRVQGHSLSITDRKLNKKAWGVGIMMEAASRGVYDKLCDLAGAQDDPKDRGWVLDEKQRPINAPQIAELLDWRDDGTFRKLLDILCDPEINWVELAEFPQREGEEGGEQGEVGEPFLNETEAEEKVKLNYETERDPPMAGREQGSVSQGPSPAMVTGTVTNLPVTVSDSAPGRAPGIKKERAQAFFQLCNKIIHPRDSSDRTTFRDIFDQLEQRMIYETDEPLFDKALEKARECCLVGKVPAAMFTEAMKQSPFCYIPVRKSTIRGRTDEFHKG